MYFYIYHLSTIILLTLDVYSLTMALIARSGEWSKLNITRNGVILGTWLLDGFPTNIRKTLVSSVVHCLLVPSTPTATITGVNLLITSSY